MKPSKKIEEAAQAAFKQAVSQCKCQGHPACDKCCAVGGAVLFSEFDKLTAPSEK